MTFPIQLYVYDLSNGLARTVSLSLTGIHIEGIWHTSIVVYGKEIFYGQGISIVNPGSTHHGTPLKVVELGETEIPPEVFFEYLEELGDAYSAAKYHVLDHNCNHFTNEVIGFLNGREIPSYIQNLPSEFLSTPFGQMIKPRIDAFFGASGQSAAVNPGMQLNGFGTLDPSTLLNNLATTSLDKKSTNSEPIKWATPSCFPDLKKIIDSAQSLIVLVESPDAKKANPTKAKLHELLSSTNYDSIRSQLKLAQVTSSRPIPPNRLEDHQTVLVQFFQSGHEVYRTGNVNPVLLEIGLKKISSSFSKPHPKTVSIDKEPKLAENGLATKESFKQILAQSSLNTQILSLWETDPNLQPTIPDQEIKNLNDIMDWLNRTELDEDKLTLALYGVAHLVKHPKLSSAIAIAAVEIGLKVFMNNENNGVREAVLTMLVNLFSSPESSRLLCSISYPIASVTQAPLLRLGQLITLSIPNPQLQSISSLLLRNVALHMNCGQFFELEDGEVWCVEVFSSTLQALLSIEDEAIILRLVDGLALAQLYLSTTPSHSILPALAQSLEVSENLQTRLSKLPETSHQLINELCETFAS